MACFIDSTKTLVGVSKAHGHGSFNLRLKASCTLTLILKKKVH
jgi:hypothetical protein